MSTGRLGAGDSAIQSTIVDAKGDLIVATAADTPARLAVGSNDQVLTADSSTATGLKWAAPSSTPSFVGVRAVTNTNQTISNATYTAVNYNQETYDTHGFHDNSTNNSRITIPVGKAGYYLLITQVVFGNNATGTRASKIQKNGADVSVVGKQSNLSSGEDVWISRSDIIYLAEGDYVQHLVYQSSGGNLSLNQDNTTFTGFTAQYLGA